MKYEIRFQHTSTKAAKSLKKAKEMVRQEIRMFAIYRRVHLFCASVPDGIYCYQSLASKNRDDTGANAFAVICGPDQQRD